jgi:hypothetical protein
LINSVANQHSDCCKAENGHVCMGEAKNQKLNLDAAQLVACNVKGKQVY